jgi:hypothetical protein
MTDGGLAQIMREALPMVHLQRIETGGTGLGIPDINGCFEGSEFWCELKSTSGYAVVIRPEQIGWAERRIRAGGRVFLLTRRKAIAGPKKGPAVDELWVHNGALARDVSRAGLKDGPLPLYRGTGGPARWDWNTILRLLTDASAS